MADNQAVEVPGSKSQLPAKAESEFVPVKKSKSSGHKSVMHVSTKSKLHIKYSGTSKSNVKVTHSGGRVRKRKISGGSDDQEDEEAQMGAKQDSSSEESSSEEEKEKKSRRKRKPAPKIGVGSEVGMKKKVEIKGLKAKAEKGEEEDAGPTEEDLIAEFIKSKQGSYKPLPPIPDPAVLLAEVMAKVAKKKGLKPEDIEALRVKNEAEINRKVEAERQKREAEQERMMEKERKDIIDAQLREDQLTKSVKIIETVIETFRDNMRIEKEKLEWELYLQCRQLPTPALCNEMTTYLQVWEENMNFITIPEASQKTQEVMELINDLEEVIALATEDEQIKLANWYWIRQLFRDYQSRCLDIATYRLLRDVVNNMERINIPLAKYDYIDPWVTLCVWLKVQNPIPLPNPRRPPRARIEITFKEVNMLKILMPHVLDCHKKAVRVMYLKYDHLSDTCEYSKTPPIPPHYEIDLVTTCKKEWRLKLKYKYARRDKKVYTEPDPDDPDSQPWEPEPEEFDSDEEIPIVPYKSLNPTPSEYLSILEVFIPKELQHVDFMIKYDAPEVYLTYNPNLPKYLQPEQEVIDQYFKQQETLETLILVTLKIPQHVIFLDPPVICMWDEDLKFWTRKYVHDSNFDEETLRFSFRTQCFGVFGLATMKYANLPYQNWEIKPEADGTITICLTGAILHLEFIVKDGMISLTLLENSPNKALQKHVVGQFYKYHILRKILKEAGVDIFPEIDSYGYIEGSCEKHWPMERHLYTNMAALAGQFNFAWSKWNVTCGRRNIVMQMRDYYPDKPKQKNHTLMLATPHRVDYIKITEESPEFSNEPQEGLKFSADLYNLMRNTSGMFLRNQVEDYNKFNIYVMSEFLRDTRLLSFA